MNQQIETGPNLALCQKWEESEAGWGIRPDGYSLHLSYDGLGRFIKRYWHSMPNYVPSEYSRPSGEPYAVEVSDTIIAELKAAGDGLHYRHNYGPLKA